MYGLYTERYFLFFVPICVLYCFLRGRIGWLYNTLLYILCKDTGPDIKWRLNKSFSAYLKY